MLIDQLDTYVATYKATLKAEHMVEDERDESDNIPDHDHQNVTGVPSAVASEQMTQFRFYCCFFDYRLSTVDAR